MTILNFRFLGVSFSRFLGVEKNSHASSREMGSSCCEFRTWIGLLIFSVYTENIVLESYYGCFFRLGEIRLFDRLGA